jgi:holo-[acyl-carrier protein] synthase
MNIGTDIVEIRRIAKLIKNRRFLERVYTDEEVRYCLSKKNKAQHFAVRFATKEAVWKALNDKKVTHKDIGVKNLPDGRPEIFIKGKKRNDLKISLSHADEYAVAVCVAGC